MAYVSYGLNRGFYESEPDKISIGTDDGGAGNHVTLAMDKTKGLTRLDVIKILEAFVRRLEDERFNDIVNV
jgi:hypothetical protein